VKVSTVLRAAQNGKAIMVTATYGQYSSRW